MDSSKAPVKLVKVTRVLGRTGTHITDSLSSNAADFVDLEILSDCAGRVLRSSCGTMR
jgi:hypothetical protein